ncbi:MAG: ATP synthase subunit I [Desulfobacterales bacterium]|nr:ATP synthase subunit I [Desulfobacterales bacterium]
MSIQERLIKFVTRANWILFVVSSMLGWLYTTPGFARGVFFGGLIVTANFQMLARTLKKALTPTRPTSHNKVIVKYYIRFVISGVIIFMLLYKNYVDPVGLVIGLSVVVVSITTGTLVELKKIIFKEDA